MMRVKKKFISFGEKIRIRKLSYDEPKSVIIAKEKAFLNLIEKANLTFI